MYRLRFLKDMKSHVGQKVSSVADKIYTGSILICIFLIILATITVFALGRYFSLTENVDFSNLFSNGTATTGGKN